MAATTVGGGQRNPTHDSAEKTDDQGAVAALQAQVESLRRRLELLERENRRLLTRMSGCPQCSKFGETSGATSQEGGKYDEFGADETAEPFIESSSIKHVIDSAKDKVPDVNGVCNKADQCIKHGLTEGPTGCDLRTHHHPKRYVALKLMYFGPRFYGFASEAQKEPTIESEIFKALDKTKLIAGNKASLCYSRCGRTDKGVSSTGQVISLYLRSKVKDSVVNMGSDQDSCDQEIDYVRVLNRVLPKDIRIIGWCAVSTDFHARFSCLCREYKYFFWRGSLDVMEMKNAAKKFIGVHDFRNFCKMDAVNVKNYTRQITSFEISPCSKIFSDDELWAMTIKGSAFLWHQVRCIVAVLFMIGEGHESPSVIDLLLDTDKIPRKPQYNMAPELPLVLRSCDFKDLKFTCTSDAMQALCNDLRKTLHSNLLQAAIFREALDCLSAPGLFDVAFSRGGGCFPVVYPVTFFAGESRIFREDCKGKRNHIPLMMRPTEPSYEERRAKLEKKNKEASRGIS